MARSSATPATSTSRSTSRRCGLSPPRRATPATSPRRPRRPTAAASSCSPTAGSSTSRPPSHPALVMDMSFANQALATEYAVQHAASLEKKVYPVPTEIDNEIARLKLETMGVSIDRLTEDQAKYLASWDQGT